MILMSKYEKLMSNGKKKPTNIKQEDSGQTKQHKNKKYQLLRTVSNTRKSKTQKQIQKELSEDAQRFYRARVDRYYQERIEREIQHTIERSISVENFLEEVIPEISSNEPKQNTKPKVIPKDFLTENTPELRIVLSPGTDKKKIKIEINKLVKIFQRK